MEASCAAPENGFQSSESPPDFLAFKLPRRAIWRTFPNLEFMNCLGFGSGILRGAGGKARSFAVRGRLREVPEGPRPEAGWRASLGRSAGILPSVPARAAGVPSPDLKFPACIVALGMEAASRFGRGRARTPPRKFSRAFKIAAAAERPAKALRQEFRVRAFKRSLCRYRDSPPAARPEVPGKNPERGGNALKNGKQACSTAFCRHHRVLRSVNGRD